jgi:hypothetical protein
LVSKEKLCFVQFIHPGGEHRPDQGHLKDWNRGFRKRKFMRIEGRCLRSGESHTGDLQFWGEWEPQSEVVARVTKPIKNGPRFIYRPFYVLPPSYKGLQYTDPFVFEQFFYAGCQQRTRTGPTQLRYLDHGSVILFGSCIGKSSFVIDTVFVVDDSVDHDAGTQSRLFKDVPEVYRDVTLQAWYDPAPDGGGCVKPPDESFRLYRGATIDRPVGEMFSFFPCCPVDPATPGFARPTIKLRGVITNNLIQGKRLNPQRTLADVQALWRRVVDQVESQGLWLGVHAAMPPNGQHGLIPHAGNGS